jgi:hypothetical protein
MDHRCEAAIRLVAAHCNSLELLELAKEVLDQVAPFVDLQVNLQWRSPAGHL